MSQTNQLNQFFEENKHSWNARTDIHQTSEMYDMTAFRAGQTSLREIELAEVGDVQGKRMLHVQCHFGQDTISWARMGAKATGTDFSDRAIEIARSLAAAESLDTRFICANTYDLPEHLDEQFDIVFTSYGVIGWLPDLKKWAEILARYVKPGGIFYMVEFHPVLWMMDDEVRKIMYSYFDKGVIAYEESDYTDHEGKHGTTKNYAWNHSLSDVITPLIAQGLTLEFLHEFDYSPYDCFQNAVSVGEKRWQVKDYEGVFPLAYSIKLRKD